MYPSVVRLTTLSRSEAVQSRPANCKLRTIFKWQIAAWLRKYPGTCLQRPRRTSKATVAGVPSETRNHCLPSTTCSILYCYNHVSSLGKSETTTTTTIMQQNRWRETRNVATALLCHVLKSTATSSWTDKTRITSEQSSANKYLFEDSSFLGHHAMYSGTCRKSLLPLSTE